MLRHDADQSEPPFQKDIFSKHRVVRSVQLISIGRIFMNTPCSRYSSQRIFLQIFTYSIFPKAPSIYIILDISHSYNFRKKDAIVKRERETQGERLQSSSRHPHSRKFSSKIGESVIGLGELIRFAKLLFLFLRVTFCPA